MSDVRETVEEILESIAIPVVKVVVDREMWDRGNTESLLLNSKNGKMCCVGFLCRTMGWSPDEIKGVATIAELDMKFEDRDFPDAWLQVNARSGIPYETAQFFQLYGTNDKEDLTDDEREALLSKQALPLGIDFEFVN